MGWTFNHHDSHYPWKQFNEAAVAPDMQAGKAVPTPSVKSKPAWGDQSHVLLLVKPNGQPVYEQRPT